MSGIDHRDGTRGRRDAVGFECQWCGKVGAFIVKKSQPMAEGNLQCFHPVEDGWYEGNFGEPDMLCPTCAEAYLAAKRSRVKEQS